ncbi:hypothetical protein L227DRAFT_29564 [Lentinus tigrinus ALCF2SS1-6]|uniref:Uncharacterized protein n=1 Tax=Lentinus tigrinus ALCF2SS1-6 TaxID=1328759 RepID=A0A5C2SEP6_9APHY|nr:hypothetical protein L227DRAFT_29564 [Lentinus tigrinus ALCF2SS1-6]
MLAPDVFRQAVTYLYILMCSILRCIAHLDAIYAEGDSAGSQLIWAFYLVLAICFELAFETSTSGRAAVGRWTDGDPTPPRAQNSPCLYPCILPEAHWHKLVLSSPAIVHAGGSHAEDVVTGYCGFRRGENAGELTYAAPSWREELHAARGSVLGQSTYTGVHVQVCLRRTRVHKHSQRHTTHRIAIDEEHGNVLTYLHVAFGRANACYNTSVYRVTTTKRTHLSSSLSAAEREVSEPRQQAREREQNSRLIYSPAHPSPAIHLLSSSTPETLGSNRHLPCRL